MKEEYEKTFEEICEISKEIAERTEHVPTLFIESGENIGILPMPFENEMEKHIFVEGAKEILKSEESDFCVFVFEGTGKRGENWIEAKKKEGIHILVVNFHLPEKCKTRIFEIFENPDGTRRLSKINSIESEEHGGMVDFSGTLKDIEEVSDCE